MPPLNKANEPKSITKSTDEDRISSPYGTVEDNMQPENMGDDQTTLQKDKKKKEIRQSTSVDKKDEDQFSPRNTKLGN